jgi:hypothetical protein
MRGIFILSLLCCFRNLIQIAPVVTSVLKSSTKSTIVTSKVTAMKTVTTSSPGSVIIQSIVAPKSQPIVSSTIPKNVLITQNSVQAMCDLTSAFRAYLCELKTSLTPPVVKTVVIPNLPRLLQSYNDPKSVVVMSKLEYHPIYFYQCIIYKKNGMYYYQEVNTGMTMNRRRMLGAGSVKYSVQNFPSREKDFQKLINILLTENIFQGMVTDDFTKLYPYVSGISETFENNVSTITTANAGDQFVACGSTNCTPQIN